MIVCWWRCDGGGCVLRHTWLDSFGRDAGGGGGGDIQTHEQEEENITQTCPGVLSRHQSLFTSSGDEECLCEREKSE